MRSPSSDAHRSRCPLCADTQAKYAKTYKKNPDKGPSCPPPGGPSCEVPGGSIKDPLISRAGPFDKISGPIPEVTTSWANAKKAEEPKKEEPKKE